MNYLISTFNGLGDGIIYYPILKSLATNNPEDIFYCTSNIFFSDEGVLNRLKLPNNIKFVSEEFRKFPKDKHELISVFIQQENINRVINLRFIGKDFEKTYFDFKNKILSSGMEVAFFDSEDISFASKDFNARQIVLEICEKAMEHNLSLNYLALSDNFPVSGKAHYTFINVHSRGDFKLWNISKWSEVVSLITALDKKVRIYEGFDSKEKEYTKNIISNLNNKVKNNIEVVSADNLLELILLVQETELLISVDSGVIHLADALSVESIGIYLTTSPRMWGGTTDKFHFIKSNHLNTCANFYPQFGMCMNNKRKCAEIEGENDDIDVESISKLVNNIYEEQS